MYFVALVIALLTVVGGYLLVRGFFIEPFDLRLEQVEVSLPDLPAGLDGARVLHLTDLHFRTGWAAKRERAYQDQLVAAARRARPDLIVLTGDYADNIHRVRRRLADVMQELCRICPQRVFAVLGDNDLNCPELAADITAVLTAGGAQVLRNQGVCLAVGLAQLYVTGVDDSVGYRVVNRHITGAQDAQGRERHLEQALAQRPGGMPTLLLAHSAAIWPQAQNAGISLLCSGHTHGGQVCLPGWGALYTSDALGRKFAAGLVRRGRMQIHVSRGVGWARLRVRFMCPPQAALLVFRLA